ncbi:hypothetical protein BJ165DRAFT_1445437 [Panaeolus papilionaceus]|nr:hypothetical protein BJ165DRAFT_1445437 [Panaeolus papilionaceus]
MSSSDDNRPVVRRNDNLRDTIMIILRQNIPGIDKMIINQVLLAKVKDIILNNMEKIAAALSGALIAIGASVLLPAIFITVINAIGFTSAGVAAGKRIRRLDRRRIFRFTIHRRHGGDSPSSGYWVGCHCRCGWRGFSRLPALQEKEKDCIDQFSCR